jgi:hypothetical protein
MTKVLVGLGGLILAAGAVLVWGNLSDRFRTLPFAGEVTMALGGILVLLASNRAQR